jgi:hypothetical protein
MIISISLRKEIYSTLISVNHEFRDWFDEATCYRARLQWTGYTMGSLTSGPGQLIEAEVHPVAEKNRRYIFT